MAMSVVRLGNQYTLGEIIDEIQVITGQLDPEIVPRLSIQEHINLAVYEVVTLLNMLCAPWFGVRAAVAALSAGDITTANGNSYKVTINGVADGTLSYYVDETLTPNIEKIIAVTNSITGTTKKCRDISQFSGIACGGNSQWKNSAIWLHHGNEVLVWWGVTMQDAAPTFNFFCYRQAVPMSLEADIIDLPDKYVPLVIAKAAVWAMKQANMGNYQIVEDQINQGILQIQKEYESNVGLQTTKSRSEGVEGI